MQGQQPPTQDQINHQQVDYNNPNYTQQPPVYDQAAYNQQNPQYNQAYNQAYSQQQTAYTQANYDQAAYAQQQQQGYGYGYGGYYGGYGDMYYNMYDPQLKKQNAPQKQDSALHVNCLVGTLFLIAGIVILAVTDLETGGKVAIFIIFYLIYLIAVVCCSSIKGFIGNLKKFDEYKTMYDSMIAGKGYFNFHIVCYHYETRTDHKGNTRQERVVTHTASQNRHPNVCEDDSGDVTGIQDIKTYVFITYLKKFYFTDDGSGQRFQKDYDSFVASNDRDTHKDHHYTFMIEGFQEQVGFSALGQGTHNSCLFYISSFLGLAIIYSCILERSVARYAINIIKKLTW